MIVVNMDLVGSFVMVKVLVEYGVMIVVYKYYIVVDWVEFVKSVDKVMLNNVMVLTGILEVDF